MPRQHDALSSLGEHAEDPLVTWVEVESLFALIEILQDQPPAVPGTGYARPPCPGG